MSATAATGRRVAVVVVPGVGDDGPGETLDAVAAALVSRIELQDGERRELMLSPAGNEVGYRSSNARCFKPVGVANDPCAHKSSITPTHHS